MQFTNQAHEIEEVKKDLSRFTFLLSKLRVTDSNLAYSGTVFTLGRFLSTTLGQLGAGFSGWHLHDRLQQTPFYQAQLECCLNHYQRIADSNLNKELQSMVLKTIAAYIRPEDLQLLKASHNDNSAYSYPQRFINYIWGTPLLPHNRYIKPLNTRKTSELIDYILYGNYTINIKSIISMGLSR